MMLTMNVRMNSKMLNQIQVYEVVYIQVSKDTLFQIEVLGGALEAAGDKGISAANFQVLDLMQWRKRYADFKVCFF